MMKIKHTPGPWATDEADHDEPYQEIKIKSGKHRTVCTVWMDDAPVHDFNAEQRINARLIAAAPDMLQALLALNELQRGKHPLKINVMAAWALLDHAIVKATGTS